MENELKHHGILGMKWGKRNGPPYPLSSAQKSISEKKQNKKPKEVKPFSLSDKQKKAIKIGSVIAAGLLVTAGAVYLAKSGVFNGFVSSGREVVSDIIGGGNNVAKGAGKSFFQINKNMVSNINSKYRNTKEGSINCFHTTLAYIGNSLFGKNWAAAPMYGVDEISGMKMEGRNVNLFHQLFSGVVETNYTKSFIDGRPLDITDISSRINNGSTGVVMVNVNTGFLNFNHYMNYEKSRTGKLTIVDPQNGLVIDSQKFRKGVYSVLRTLDFSNATLNDNIEEILRNLVE